MENMEYYSQRLPCSDAEKDACLETVAKVFRLRALIRRWGVLEMEVLAEKEPDPFFRACLQEFAASFWEDPSGLEPRLEQYLVAGDYRGGAFLNAVVILRGMVQLFVLSRDQMGIYFMREWGDLLSEAVRGYFGADYRQKVIEVIDQEVVEHRRRVSANLEEKKISMSTWEALEKSKESKE